MSQHLPRQRLKSAAAEQERPHFSRARSVRESVPLKGKARSDDRLGEGREVVQLDRERWPEPRRFLADVAAQPIFGNAVMRRDQSEMAVLGGEEVGTLVERCCVLEDVIFVHRRPIAR